MPVAIITGGSRGLGRALAAEFARRDWGVVIDGRDEQSLAAAAAAFRRSSPNATVVDIAGDIADAAHRERLVAAAESLGGLDVLVNNASVLGPSPQPELAAYPLEVLRAIYEVNTIAPLGLLQICLEPLRRSGGTIVNVTSDAGVEGYAGWGGYGSSKAALEQLSNVLAAEEPDVHVYWFDPGDMRTEMHQQAFPDEDISDRPDPESVVPAFFTLVDGRRPSGRFRASDLRVAASGAAHEQAAP